ncbi:Hypothetical predicted protein [Xyrichtys novacula]|uniref:Uncharacterized protein n=1 Tax=Xyrichtys novacula TaxID=13765 RepID=A0AAV1F400_XYRNO|nr:Hypothetical predicted protein [Xyrichtys novacula]
MRPSEFPVVVTAVVKMQRKVGAEGLGPAGMLGCNSDPVTLQNVQLNHEEQHRGFKLKKTVPLKSQRVSSDRNTLT